MIGHPDHVTSSHRPASRLERLLAGLILVAPGAFTTGWLLSGRATPEYRHAVRSISALSRGGQPAPGPVLAGSAVQALAQLANAELARRRGQHALAALLAVSGVATGTATAVPLPHDGGPRWRDLVHTWSSGIGIAAFHLAPLAGATDPRLPRWSRRLAMASLGVAIPATGYFTWRLARHGGLGEAYGYAERTFLMSLLGWTTTLAAVGAAAEVGAEVEPGPIGHRVPLTGGGARRRGRSSSGSA